MPPKRILFVNKTIDSKSLSQSEGLEKARIFSHVRPLPASKAKDKQSPSSSSVQFGSRTVTQRFSGDVAEAGGSSKEASNTRTYDAPREPERSSDKRIGTPARPQCCHAVPRDVSSKLDCFNCTVVPMDPFMEDIFSRCKWI